MTYLRSLWRLRSVLIWLHGTGLDVRALGGEADDVADRMPLEAP